MDVIRLPPEVLDTFLKKELAQAVRIQAHCCDDWEMPTEQEKDALMELVLSKKRFVPMGAGSRCGKDRLGAFMHQDHNKRYFGILRAQAPVSITSRFPEAVKATGFDGGVQHQLARASALHLPGKGIEETLGSLLVQIPYMSSGSRQQVLRASFARMDKDNSGELNRSEIANMIRRVVPKFSGRQVSDILKDIDTDENDTVNYEEFLAWLESQEAHEQRSDASGPQKETNSIDVINATFRTWDADGDGLISKRELAVVMKEISPEITKDKLRQLWLHLDVDRDDKVGYQEFVDFMFPGAQS